MCSKLVYDCEAWPLDDKTCKMLNGTNSKMVSRITDRPIREEASTSSKTFDVVKWIRVRRLQWVGHILRFQTEDEERLNYKAVEYIYTQTQTASKEIYSWTFRPTAADST